MTDERKARIEWAPWAWLRMKGDKALITVYMDYPSKPVRIVRYDGVVEYESRGNGAVTLDYSDKRIRLGEHEDPTANELLTDANLAEREESDGK